MPFSVRQIALDDKLCHQVSLEVLQEVSPLETGEQVRSSCHAWEKREKALTMVAIVYLVIALPLFPRLTVGGESCAAWPVAPGSCGPTKAGRWRRRERLANGGSNWA